jgi:hypothetical protein
MLSKTTMLRRSSVSRVTLALLLGLGTSLGGAGCKSGEGERCQITSDCEDGLVCADSTNTCVESVNQGVDGGVDAPIDASEADAMVTDAAIDGVLEDAPTDALLDLDAL